jgi:hypothetical protein
MASIAEKDGISAYSLTFPELDRTLTINFRTTFPHTIESWTDEFKSGWGVNAKTMTSRATKINTIKVPYWQQNGNKDIFLREKLGL